jgi:hypothetical protein
MIYAPWSDQDRFGSDRFGSDLGSVLGPDLSSDLGTDRFGSDRFSVICVIIGNSPYPGNIPSIPDYPKYRITISVP